MHFAASLFVLIIAASPCLAETDLKLPEHLPAHPRLLMTDSDLASAVAAAKTDPLRAALHARIISSAEALLKAPPLQHKLIGPRMLDQSRSAIQHIVTCAMAYRLTGDPRFADKARRDMLTAAAFADWNPSHFLDIAEMSFACGIGYDWLYSTLSPEDRQTIKTALLEKSLVFAKAAYAPGGPTDSRVKFPTLNHNWNQVCNGGLLTAALAVGDDDPALVRLVVGGVRSSLPLVMNRYQPDGAYPEGPGYWAYGTNYNVIALAEMEGVLGTDFGLGKIPAFDKTAVYRMAVQGPTGLGFNYADGSANMEEAPAYTWLATRYHHPAAERHSRALLEQEIKKKGAGDRFLALQAVWFPVEPGPDHAESLPLDFHFRGTADVAVFRSAWNDPAALFVGFKAGSNTANHAHLDLGSFILEADHIRWGIDFGPDNYNLPDYFGNKRWTYFRLNNRGHSTLIPGDLLQKAKGEAPIIAFASTPEKAFAVADLSGAYPGAAQKIERGIAVVDRSRVLIQDEITGANAGYPWHWQMVTGANIEISEDGRSAQLLQNGKQLRAEVLAPEGARFQIASTRPPTDGENQNAGTSILAIDLAPSGGNRLIEVLLSPVGPAWPSRPAPELGALSAWR